ALTMADRIAVMDAGRIQQYAPPRDIYDDPANAFVAGFIGETNFIDGIAGQSGEHCRFTVDGSGQTVEVEGACPVNGASRLAVQPELVRLGPEAGARLTGTIEEMIYGGGTVACHVRVAPGATIMARVPTGA